MTAPFGNPGADRDLIEQRFRDLAARLSAVEQRAVRTPSLPIPLFPKFAPPAGVFATMANAVDLTERTLWDGRIAYLSQPYIQVDGIWGAASGTNTTRYRLKVNNTTVGTWDIGVLETSHKGPYVIYDATGVTFGSWDIGVQVTAQSLSGSGTYACQILGCDQRQQT